MPIKAKMKRHRMSVATEIPHTVLYLRIPEAMKQELLKICSFDNASLNYLCIEAISQYLERRNEKANKAVY